MAIRDPERFFDQRTVKRHLKRGHVSDADYDRFIESLPDSSENIKPREEGGDDDGYEATSTGDAGAAEGAPPAGAAAEGAPPGADATGLPGADPASLPNAGFGGPSST